VIGSAWDGLGRPDERDKMEPTSWIGRRMRASHAGTRAAKARPGRIRLAALASAAVLLPACAAASLGGVNEAAPTPGAEQESTTAPTAATERESTAPPTAAHAPAASAEATPVEVELSVVASDLDAPWGLVFAGERVFITERDSGRVLELVHGRTTEVTTLQVDNEGEGGLLGIAASPTFAQDGLLYAYLTTAGDNRVVPLHRRRGSAGAGAHRHPGGSRPQRRSTGVRQRRLALHRHG